MIPDPLTCVVCGAKLPHMTRADAIAKGAASVIAGLTHYHCIGRHSESEVMEAIHAEPVFQRAGKLMQPTHGVEEGIMYRPTRGECPFSCILCDSVQRKTCEEIDASMIRDEGIQTRLR